MKLVPFSRNREAIYDLLSRAKRYHATTSVLLEPDVTALLAALAARRAAGRPLGLLACLVKATSLLLAEHRRLNHHLFHGLFRKYVVDFERVACNLVMLRTADTGERILLPVVIERSDELSLDEIQGVITHHLRTPLGELPQIQALERLKRLPRFVLSLFSYRCRSDHRFYRRFFGTYGLSPLFAEDDGGVREGQPGVPTHSISNTCSAFFPSGVADKAVVMDGQVVVRKKLAMMFSADHFLVDGHDILFAALALERLLADPSRLGL